MAYKKAQERLFQILGYVPTEAQWVIHRAPIRIKQIAGGERAGKSMVNEKELVTHWFVDYKKKDKLYWIAADDYEGCRGEWEHLLEDFYKLEQLAIPPTKNIDPGLVVLLDGTRIVTKSAKYPERIATVAPDGILICEAAQIEYETFLRFRARLAEKRGWLSMAGTFEEEEYVDWYRELYELGQSYNTIELQSFSLPTWSNVVIFPGGREDPEILKQEQGMTPERFQERFGGVPCPKTGRVITEFANAIHVGDYQFNPNLPVEIAVDPGYAGAYAVLAIQNWGEQIALIDEIYVQGVVTKDIILMAKKKPWFNAIKGGAIDIAAKQHQADEPVIDIWRSSYESGGAEISLQCKRVGNVEDGIDLLRTHLKQHPITGKPGVLVDAKCKGFIAECGGGRSPVDGGGIWMRDKNTLKPIDKNNHSIKALIYYLVNKFGYTGKATRIRPMRLAERPSRNVFART